jgi:hypothetical protein
VSFRVNGFAQDRFAGTLRRVDAAANATTRQVAVVVDFVDPRAAPQVAGLFAEGLVQTGGQQVLTLPEGALVRAGEVAYAWRVAGGAVNKVDLKLGERDLRTGEFPVLSGLAVGDRVLRNPGSTLVDGQKAEMAVPAVAAVPTPSASARHQPRPASRSGGPMFLSEFSIKRPIATVVIIIGLMAMGLLALSKLRVNQIPDVEQPLLTVGITYPGASPDTVEREVINRIEKALQGIAGVDQVRSTASEGYARIVLVFNFDKKHDRSGRRGAQCHRLGAPQAAGGNP